MLKSKKFKKLSCGSNFTMGITHSEELMGWGDLSKVGFPNEKVIVPTIITTDNFVHISAGKSHCAAIDKSGKVFFIFIYFNYILVYYSQIK